MAPTLDAPHVLVYDDDPTILRLYAEMLGEEGYRVTLVGGGDGGTPEGATTRPDLVVVDLFDRQVQRNLGVLDRFRSRVATEHPPVLVCSGDTLMLDRLGPQLRAWGCAIVAKPFDIDVFLATVSRCLDRVAADAPVAA